MNSILVICALAMVSLMNVGCASERRSGGAAERRHSSMEVYVQSNGDRWISTGQMDQAARRYAKAKGIDFDFAGAETTVIVPATEAGRIASVQYSAGIGHPMLTIDIGHNAEVTGHRINTAVDKLYVGPTPKGDK